MASKELIDYIIEQLNAGFDENTIEQHLINHNYSKESIGEAMVTVNTQLQQSSLQVSQNKVGNEEQQIAVQQAHVVPQLPQADPQIVSFVTQQRNQGFTQEQIRQYLLNYNYTQQQIDPAIDAVFHPATKSTSVHISHLGAIIISTIVLVSVFSGAGLFFFFENIGDDTVNQLLDYKIDTTISKLFAGDQLDFDIYLENYGNDKRYDVFLTHTLKDKDDNELDTIQETAAVETNTKLTSKFSLDNKLKPGRYKVLSTGKYEDKEVSSAFTFTVEATQGKPEETPKQPITQKPIEIPDTKPTQPEPVVPKTQPPEPIAPQIPDPIETPTTVIQPETPANEILLNEIETDVTILAADPATVNKADDLCRSLTIEIEQGYCYSKIAEVSKQKNFCNKITDTYERDLCYINNFVFAENDFTVCAQIIDYDLNAVCNQMAETDIDLSPTAISEETVDGPENTPIPESTSIDVSIQDFTFIPSEIRISVGDTITWTNNDNTDHTVLANDGSFSSEVLQTGHQFSFKFEESGTFEYICGIHPTMQGTIIVE
jgi:plastocyanin